MKVGCISTHNVYDKQLYEHHDDDVSAEVSSTNDYLTNREFPAVKHLVLAICVYAMQIIIFIITIYDQFKSPAVPLKDWRTVLGFLFSSLMVAYYINKSISNVALLYFWGGSHLISTTTTYRVKDEWVLVFVGCVAEVAVQGLFLLATASIVSKMSGLIDTIQNAFVMSLVSDADDWAYTVTTDKPTYWVAAARMNLLNGFRSVIVIAVFLITFVLMLLLSSV